MNATPNSREARLIGGIIVSSPLELHILAGSAFETETGVGRRSVGGHSSRKKRRTGHRSKDFRSGAAEGAVAGDVSGKSWSNEVGSLIWHPSIGMDPMDTAISRGGVVRLTWPGEDRNF